MKEKDEKMKRLFLTLLLIIAILLAAVGGGYYFIIRPRLPEWTVEQMMEQIDELDLDALGLGDGLTESQEELFGIILEKVLDNLTYEIIDSRIEGQMAYVTVSLETIDTPRLVTDNIDIILSNAISNLGNLIMTILGDGTAEMIVQEFINLLADDALVVSMRVQEVEIPLERSGFFWIPILTDEFLLSIVGLDESLISLLDLLINHQ